MKSHLSFNNRGQYSRNTNRRKLLDSVYVVYYSILCVGLAFLLLILLLLYVEQQAFQAMVTSYNRKFEIQWNKTFIHITFLKNSDLTSYWSTYIFYLPCVANSFSMFGMMSTFHVSKLCDGLRFLIYESPTPSLSNTYSRGITSKHQRAIQRSKYTVKVWNVKFIKAQAFKTSYRTNKP